MRRAILSVAASIALTGAPAAGGAPSGLYQTLRTSSYPDIALPAAYSSAKVKAAPVTSSARSHGAVGAVEVEVNGPDADAGVMFVVFKTAGGAASSLGLVVPSGEGLAVDPAGKVPGQSQSAVFAGSTSQTDALGQSVVQGVTYAVVQHGTVLVAGFTYGPTKLRDAGGAAALARSGLRHLEDLGG